MRFGDAPSRARRILSKGDTILSTVRTYLKAVYFVEEDADDLVASTGFATLTPAADVLPEYLGHVLQSGGFVERVMTHSVGVAYPAIAESRLGSLELALPASPEEQSAIVGWMEASTRELKTAIAHARRQIALIREYRTRLIADVVTGKLDVRQVASGAPAMANGQVWPEEAEAALSDGEGEEAEDLDGAAEMESDDGQEKLSD